tara:strand:+ start:156 stop:455 length:300 start_codon:yes stop_codon:yes gene_type:complete
MLNMIFGIVKKSSFLLFKKFNFIKKLKFIRYLSYPAIEIPEDFPKENNITFILDHGYVCPICKDTGVVLCKLCKTGCIFCSYSKFRPCKCCHNLYPKNF